MWKKDDLLEIWEAQRLDHVLDTGRTKPVVLECVLKSETQIDKRLMVVKALGLQEITETGLACEMYGHLLAQRLGIRVPGCALVNVSPQLADVMRPLQHPPGLNAGFGVGSEYIRGGFTPMIVDAIQMPDEVRQAAAIYAFDMLVQNPDRLPSNANCGFHGKDILIYDFETCFSFLRLFGAQPEAWEVSKTGMASHHLFYGLLRRQNINFRPFVDEVAHLNEAVLSALAQRLPSEWQSRTPKITAHLLSAAAHPRKLERELLWGLA